VRIAGDRNLKAFPGKFTLRVIVTCRNHVYLGEMAERVWMAMTSTSMPKTGTNFEYHSQPCLSDSGYYDSGLTEQMPTNPHHDYHGNYY
jgi:hypothetical protein